jgi:hypothetical protein
LRREVARWAAALNLDKNAPDLLWQFESCFYQPETSLLAQQIAHTYGRKLGFLLLMLKRADPENRAARPEWGEAHWQFWRDITTIIVGGGMLAGRLGEEALPVAQAVLAQHGFAGVSLTRSPYAAHLPLVGLARTHPLPTPAMLVFDFGQTAIKRAVARYDQGQVTALHILPPLPTVCADLSVTDRPFELVQRQWQQMLAVVEDTWRQNSLGGGMLPPNVGGNIPPPSLLSLGLCLSCYLFDGQPSPDDHGCYGSLQKLSPNLERFIQDQITGCLQMETHVGVFHDGTAAAIAHAGQAQSVVLTFGTAIGNGFPPPAEDYRPLAAEFRVLQ